MAETPKAMRWFYDHRGKSGLTPMSKKECIPISPLKTPPYVERDMRIHPCGNVAPKHSTSFG